jgi:hypothetical protein
MGCLERLKIASTVRVDRRANSDIECVGGIWRVIEDSGMLVYRKEDHGVKGVGLVARSVATVFYNLCTHEA